jgi:hypothetical protein
MKIVEKVSKPLIVLFLAITGVIIPQVVFAVPEFVINLVTLLPLFFLNILVDISLEIVEIAGRVVNWVLAPDFIKMSYTNPSTNTVIKTGLGVTQSLVNMILILILIYIALATILRLQEYQAQKLLPIFIIIALLVNFTPVICGIIVDASNIIMNFFVSNIQDGITGLINGWRPKMGDIGTIWPDHPSWSENGKAALQQAILVPFLGILSFILILFALLFILRYMAIWILVILSPIAFIAYILPVTRSWWTLWWKQFLNWCFIGAFASFFLYLSLFFVTYIQKSVSVPDNITPVASGAFAGALPYLTGIVFLGIGLITALKTSAMGTGAVIKFAQSKGRAYGTKAARMYARELGGYRTAARAAAAGARVGAKVAKRYGAERPARAAMDKIARAASRAGDWSIPGTGGKIKPLAPLKWVTPKV